MQIKTEADMRDFCRVANILGTFTFDFPATTTYPEEIELMEKYNQEAIRDGLIEQDSHLQQGIKNSAFCGAAGPIKIQETPYLYPSPKLLEVHPHLTGPMTGNLSNCYDPNLKRFLFHMRGKDIANPWGFQAAAAGMGRFGEPPCVTAYKEVQEEAGIEFPIALFGSYAHRASPFMKTGQVPQPLFSYGFEADLSQFRVCNNLDDIEVFESRIKMALSDGSLKPKEAYHFTLPYKQVEQVIGELHDLGRFYGPIQDSTLSFVRTLKNTGHLS